MKLDKNDIKSMEPVGKTDKGDLYHVCCKGGLNLIVEKTAGGEFNILGSASHRAYSRHQAENSGRKLQFDESLWKSERDDLYKAPREYLDSKGNKVTHFTHEEWTKKQKESNRDYMGNPIYESTPQNHYDLASHHSKMAGKARETERQLKTRPPEQVSVNDRHNAIMRNLMHSDMSLKHFQMSGLSHKQAHEQHAKQMDLHHELQEGTEAPFQDYALELAFNRANPDKKTPKGLGWSWSE